MKLTITIDMNGAAFDLESRRSEVQYVIDRLLSGLPCGLNSRKAATAYDTNGNLCGYAKITGKPDKDNE